MVQCHNCLQSHGVNSNLDLLRGFLHCSSSYVDIGTDDLNIGIYKRLKNGIRTELLKSTDEGSDLLKIDPGSTVDPDLVAAAALDPAA